MSQEIETRKGRKTPAKQTKAAERLEYLAAAVEQDMAALDGIGRTALVTAHRLGGLLIEAKELVKYGEWLDWLAARGVKARTATNYMRIHREFRSAPGADLGIKEAVAMLTKPMLQETEKLHEFASADDSDGRTKEEKETDDAIADIMTGAVSPDATQATIQTADGEMPDDSRVNADIIIPAGEMPKGEAPPAAPPLTEAQLKERILEVAPAEAWRINPRDIPDSIAQGRTKLERAAADLGVMSVSGMLMGKQRQTIVNLVLPVLARCADLEKRLAAAESADGS